MTSCRGVDLAVAAAGFSLVPRLLPPPFWFLPKLSHLEENDYSRHAAKTTYQQFHTLQKRTVRGEEGMSTCSGLENISTLNK